MSARPYPPEPAASLELGVSDTDTVTRVSTFDDGSFYWVLRAADGYYISPGYTLGQAIQLRDFLNRHIDGLALKQTGSLAERADDGTDQLAAVEQVASQLPIRVPKV